MEKLNNDIYDITNTIVDIEQRYIEEENPEVLAISTFGAVADISALSLQNAIISTSELGNELFPARAKYEKNLLSHAVVNNIENINAVPASIKCIIGVFESDFEKYSTNDIFYLDKEIAFYIEDKEFHLDYDILIRKNTIANNNYAYTAQYNMTTKNQLSDISSVYLDAPIVQYYNGSKVICFYTLLRQVAHTVIPKNIITNNIIENKTLQFKFDNQLSDFYISAKDGNTTTLITPILEGSGVFNTVKTYCYYSYIDANHIKVRFDSGSYIPKMNTEILIVLKTTKGSEGNFEYSQKIFPIVNSTIYGYTNVPLIVIFGGKSSGGLDRISTKELKSILPKESLSRGSITCQKDLDNHFSMYNTDTNRLITQKRVDNQFERSYYTYLLLKDPFGNVVPTNTFDIRIERKMFNTHDNRKYVLKPGCYIILDIETNIGTVLLKDSDNSDYLDDLKNNDKTKFLYTTPFMIVVTGDPLYVSYYLSIINETRYLDFVFVNMDSILQFICVNISWYRGYINNPNTYVLSFQATQNFGYDKQLISYDDNGNIIDSNLKAIVVIYNSDNSDPYRYIEANVLKTDTDTGTFQFNVGIETTDIINDDNKVKILNTYIPGTSVKDYGYFSKDISVNIYVCVKLEEGEFGRYDLDSIVPGLEGWTVSNVYSVNNGLPIYINYSQILHSQAKDIIIPNEYTDEHGFYLTSVPCVRNSYINSDSNMDNLVSEINYKKAYIDNSLKILDNNMSIDFKLFCTYGPSRTYAIDKTCETMVDRVNLTLNFALKLVSSADKSTKDFIIDDIKNYLEDLNDISSLHMPNLITQITTDYRQLIEYFEFIGFNDYGPGVQHLYRNIIDDASITPEFLTVHTNQDLSPDIEIRLD